MIKNKNYTANIHVSSLNRDVKLPLWDTESNSFVNTHMLNNVLSVKAEDKQEARRKFYAMVRKLQTKVKFVKGMFPKQGDQATFYINQIWEK
tara:strand:+ start:2169 stop:2444 length:276 start_codon:yes stop_codon:yes gene_type:complete